MNNQSFFAFHIGPVQDFIATARRTQDLWMGSWLLSRLSRVAFETAQNNGAEPVLPKELAAQQDKTDADVPNHFIMRLPSKGRETIAQTVEQAVRDEWQKIESKTKDKFFADVSDALWQRQIGNLLELYWALVDDDGTPMARNRAQVALDARKRVKNFVYVEEYNLKCALCGQRQEVSEAVAVRDAKNWWEQRTQSYKGRLRVRENRAERLCAVCATKRAALNAGALQHAGLTKPDGHFPSTSSVAAAMFKKHLLETIQASSELEVFLEALKSVGFADNDRIDRFCLPALESSSEKNAEPLRSVHDKLLRFDGDLFYVETFTEKRIEKEFKHIYEAILQRGVDELNSQPGDKYTVKDFLELEPDYVRMRLASVTAGLRSLYSTAKMKPSKYFAALMMDGDYMGQFFGKADEAQAQALSEHVSKFAREQAKQIVNANFGRLVYAGGDDVLALLPLATAIKCARELQEGFKNAVDGVRPPAGINQLPTPSVGIAIAHHTAPLDLTLQTMEHAEKAAKNYYGRDALCVHVLKRSGEEVRVGTHWTNDANESLVSLVEETIELLSADVFSMKFAYAVAAEARALNADDMPLESRTAALRRLAKRQSGGNSDEARGITLAEKLARWSTTQRGAKDKEKPLGTEEVAQWILLARFIAGGGRDEE